MRTATFMCFCLAAAASCSENTPAMGVDLGATQDLRRPGADLSEPDMATTPLSVRAQRGFLISPIGIDTSGMSYAQKELVGTGAYLTVALNCANCHAGPPAFMGGGRSFGTSPNFVYARNLTSHQATGMKLTEAQFIESMRTGKDFVDNGQLQNMPFTTYRWLTTYDLQAIYAYLKALPPVANAVTADNKATPGTPAAAPTDYSDGDVTRPLPPDNTVDPIGELRGQALQPLADPANFGTFSDATKRAFGRGAYLVTLLGCNGCHTNPATTAGKITTSVFLSGGRIFPTAAASQASLGTVRVMSGNLTGQQFSFKMTQDQFVQTLSTHRHADEPSLRPLGSPMPDFKYLVTEDMIALYTYLTSVPRRTGTSDKATQDYARFCTANSQCNTAAGESCAMLTSECVGKTCAVDGDCDACQTCSAAKVCVAPIATSACLTGGI